MRMWEKIDRIVTAPHCSSFIVSDSMSKIRLAHWMHKSFTLMICVKPCVKPMIHLVNTVPVLNPLSTIPFYQIHRKHYHFEDPFRKQSAVNDLWLTVSKLSDGKTTLKSFDTASVFWTLSLWSWNIIGFVTVINTMPFSCAQARLPDLFLMKYSTSVRAADWWYWLSHSYPLVNV